MHSMLELTNVNSGCFFGGKSRVLFGIEFALLIYKIVNEFKNVIWRDSKGENKMAKVEAEKRSLVSEVKKGHEVT